MKKVLAIFIVLALLILQIPSAVFATNDVEGIITSLNGLDATVKSTLLEKIWDYTVPELNANGSITSTQILNSIKNDSYITTSGIWGNYIDNSSTSGDGKIAESTLKSIIDQMLTYKSIIISIHNSYKSIIDKSYIKTALGLTSNATEGAVFTKLIQKSGPILTSSGNTFSNYPGAGSTLVSKLSLSGFNVSEKAVLAALIDAQLQTLADSMTTYIGSGYINSTSIINLLNIYNMYGVVSSGSGSGSGTGSGTTGATTPAADKDTVTVTTTLDTAGTASAPVSADTLNKAFDNATAEADGTKTVTVKLEEIAGAKAYAPTLPAANLAAADNKEQIVVKTPLGNLELPGNMFKAADLGTAADVKVSIGITDASSIKDASLKAEIGNRPVVELSVAVNGTAKAWNNPDAPVTVAVKYTPSAAELKDSDFITIYYIDGAGNAIAVPNARYDSASGTVIFSTTHFSKYAVAFIHNIFSDLTKYAWAKSSVEVLSSKGILTGISADKFSPETIISRDEFLAGIVRAFGLSAKVESNFSDVNSANKYYSEIGIAKKLGITDGIGNNKFGADTFITRQDMMVLVARAMKYAGKPGAAGTDSDIAKFTDKSKIRGYAKESIATCVKNGIIEGDGKILNPAGNLTKAEAAVVLYRMFKK